VKRREVRRIITKLTVTVMAWGLMLVVIFPLLWMVSSSLKGPREIMSTPPSLIPKHVVWDNYEAVFGGDFGLWFRNSVVVAVATTLVVMVVAALGSYSMVRFSYRGRGLISAGLLSAYLLPQVLLVVPLFLVMSKLHLTNSHVGLVVANTTFALPFAVWLLREYFKTIPFEVEEAAMVDGASRVRSLVQVVVPQALPGLISTAIFTFILAWNEYLFALVFLSDPRLKTLPVGIATYANNLDIQWGPLMASSVVVTVPVLVFFMFLQRRLVGGIGDGAVKG